MSGVGRGGLLLAGNLLNASGMTARLVDFAVALVGFIRGGLGHAVVVANIIMSGMSGSAFIACQIAGVSVNEFTRAVWRPFFALVLALVVCAIWPGLVLFLSNAIMGR
jgi:TRAP-type C4-dicarboxylate transport system permease large subunit